MGGGGDTKRNAVDFLGKNTVSREVRMDDARTRVECSRLRKQAAFLSLEPNVSVIIYIKCETIQRLVQRKTKHRGRGVGGC